MLSTMVIVSSLAAGLSSSGEVAGVARVSTPSQQVAAQGDFRLRARLNGSGLASGKADYRERERNGQTRVRMSVEIEDAPANTTYDVAHNGVVFAEITTNEFGFADLNLRGSGNIPAMAAGDTIEVVGLVSGVLEID